MDDIVETKLIDKYRIDIVNDYDCNNPNDDFCDDEVFVVFEHRDFCVRRKGFDPQTIYDESVSRGKKMYDGYWVFQLYAYIHGGVVLSVGGHSFPDARWDVSSTGFVLVKRMKGWSYTIEQAFEHAKGITETWNQYLGGDVYGYKISMVDRDDPDEILEELDSCWGYYGLENCMTEAESIVKHILDKECSDLGV